MIFVRRQYPCTIFVFSVSPKFSKEERRIKTKSIDNEVASQGAAIFVSCYDCESKNDELIQDFG